MEENMSRLRIFAFITLITLAFAVTLIADALAGEKGKVVNRNVFCASSFPSVKVPDVEGHAIYLVDAKGIGFDEAWGVSAAVCTGTSEVIKGGGPVAGYTYFTFADGSTLTSKYKGEAKGVAYGTAGRREGEGTWAYVKGTGRFAGIQGEGTYKWYVVAPGIWYADNVGEYTLP
jgi:hypothetical protein